jgi:hypothetical protein
VLFTALFFCPINVFAQAVDKEPDPAAIVELGGAAGRDLKGGGSSFGGDLAVEFTPIEKWLEIEAGTTPLFRRHSTEWDTDRLFKKPWTLSEKVEFMFGVGPERILDVASRKIRLVLDDLATIPDEAAAGFFDIGDGNCEHRPERRTALDEQVDVRAVEADHVGRFVGDGEPELFDVEGGRVVWIFHLNQNIGAKLVCHVRVSRTE